MRKFKILALAISVELLLGITVNLSPVSADTPLAVEIISLGSGTSILDVATVTFRVAGGTSTSYQTCASYLEAVPDIKIGFSVDGKAGIQNDPVYVFNPQTLELKPTYMICSIGIAPLNYFGYQWKFPTSSVTLSATIYNSNLILATKSIIMVDRNSVLPLVNITSPLRGSDTSGDITMTLSHDNSDTWIPTKTYVGAILNGNGNCFSYHLDTASALGPIGSTIWVQATFAAWSLRVLVTNTSLNSIRYRFLQKGVYTLCVTEDYVYSNDKSRTARADKSVIINVTEPVKTLAFDHRDPFLEGVEQFENLVKTTLSCPANISSASSTFQCTLLANGILSSGARSNLYLTSATTLEVTGYMNYTVCVLKSSLQHGGYCSNDSHLIPDYFSDIYPVSVTLGEKKKIEVKNYLKTTGYTAVQIEISDPQLGAADAQTYSYQASNYQANQQKRASAPPSSASRKQIAASIRGAMLTKCQVLPSGFARYSIIYVKRISSNDGVPGFLFKVGGKMVIQIYDMGQWNFGPSFAPSDQKLWEAWGCGTRSILTN
jgi:hypothetical protein